MGAAEDYSGSGYGEEGGEDGTCWKRGEVFPEEEAVPRLDLHFGGLINRTQSSVLRWCRRESGVWCMVYGVLCTLGEFVCECMCRTKETITEERKEEWMRQEKHDQVKG